jgi:hypothetical protein
MIIAPRWGAKTGGKKMIFLSSKNSNIPLFSWGGGDTK